MTKVYDITTIHGMATVPPDRREAMLTSLRDLLVAGDTPQGRRFIAENSTFEWVDNGGALLVERRNGEPDRLVYPGFNPDDTTVPS